MPYGLLEARLTWGHIRCPSPSQTPVTITASDLVWHGDSKPSCKSCNSFGETNVRRPSADTTFCQEAIQSMLQHQPGIFPSILLAIQASQPRGHTSQVKIPAQVALGQGLGQQQVMPLALLVVGPCGSFRLKLPPC